MSLETGSFISDLNASNPTSTDLKSQGDDHIRLLKATVKGTFPNVSGAVTVTHTELNTVTAKANSASPLFTGLPLAPTAAVSTATTQLATTAFVVSQVANDAPTKSGSGATGTWPVSITGNAATATLAANGGVTSVNGSTGAVTISIPTPASPIGVGQSWQRPSRGLGTTYTNSTGRPIQVTASVYAQGSTHAIVTVDGVTIFDSYTQDCCGVPQISYFPMSFIVPSASTYQITGGALSLWAELR